MESEQLVSKKTMRVPRLQLAATKAAPPLPTLLSRRLPPSALTSRALRKDQIAPSGLAAADGVDPSVHPIATARRQHPPPLPQPFNAARRPSRGSLHFPPPTPAANDSPHDVFEDLAQYVDARFAEFKKQMDAMDAKKMLDQDEALLASERDKEGVGGVELTKAELARLQQRVREAKERAARAEVRTALQRAIASVDFEKLHYFKFGPPSPYTLLKDNSPNARPFALLEPAVDVLQQVGEGLQRYYGLIGGGGVHKLALADAAEVLVGEAADESQSFVLTLIDRRSAVEGDEASSKGGGGLFVRAPLSHRTSSPPPPPLTAPGY
jgi:hypothetical protein